MLNRRSRCPDASDLAACLEPIAHDKPEMYDHLSHCADCRATLDALVGDATWWSEVGGWLSTSEDRAVQRITQSLCALSLEQGQAAMDDPLCDFEIEQLESLIEPASHPELLGRINRYELEQLVGRGGMGLVFRARDTELHRVVAVKTLAIHLIPIGAARERFIREARACAALVHPHIVPVHDVITDGPIPALVMQYVAGPTLEGHLAAHGPLAWQDVLQLAIQLCDALAAAHAHGLVHRDIKPGNVLLEADGSRALLTDFGLVRALDNATRTRSGLLAGTPDYMSPEQARGESVDQRSDLFSLGSMFYAMLTGHPPFRASDAMAVMNCICHTSHRSIANDHPQVPLEISRMVDKLLAKEPGRRFSSAAELRQHLQGLVHARLQLRKNRRLRTRAFGPALWATAAMALVAMLWQWPGMPASLTGDDATHPGTSLTAPYQDNDVAADVTATRVQDAEEYVSLSDAYAQSMHTLDSNLQQLGADVEQLLREFTRPGPTARDNLAHPLTDIDRHREALTHALQRLEVEMRQR